MVDKRQPWMKFYPGDWRADPRLRMCSLAARGLWMDMLALMHEATPYGHLLVNDTQPTDKQLSALVGAPTGKLVDELERAGVFSRTDEGIIFSRRMVRDKAKSDRDRENGKGGGNPKITHKVKRGVNPPDKAQKPEARDQTPEDHDSENHEVAAREPSTEFDGVPEAEEPSRKILIRPLRGGGLQPIGSAFIGGKRLKSQDKADAEMRAWLHVKHRMTLQDAAQTVDAARDPAHPEHDTALSLCLRISRENTMGWFEHEGRRTA